MQPPFGALIVKLKFNKWRRDRGRQPAGPAGGGATLVVLEKCSMSCNGQLWRPGGISRSVYYYVFCLVSTLFSFKIRSTDHYCKTTHRAKSRFSINFYPFGFILRRFFSAFKREVIFSLTVFISWSITVNKQAN